MKFFEKHKNIFLIIFLGFLVRLLLSPFGTLALDQNTFVAWSMNLAENGFGQFYNSWSDYLPGYLYVLYFLGKLNSLNLIPQEILYKIPAILADGITGFLIYKILNKTKTLPAQAREKLSLIGASIYVFNPAIFANSALWGQVDSFVALFSMLAIYLLNINYVISTICLAFGTLIKPQVAFVFPVILFLMFKEKFTFQKIFTYLIIGLFVFILGFLPFVNQDNFLLFILERLDISANQYPYTSVNAFNFWALFGFWKSDSNYFGIGLILALIISVTSFMKNKSPYFLAFVILTSTFLFMTRMHERHFLSALAPLAILVIESPILAISYIIFSLIYVANLHHAYQWIAQDFMQIFPDFIVKLFSLLNIGALGFVIFAYAKNFKLKFKLSLGESKSNFPKINLSPKLVKILLAVILVFAFATRIFNLGSPEREYFDEVYHAFTARTILHNDPKAWEWWNTPPEGFAYEWTHPPLAKLGMWAGMVVFGENAFGWRFPGALLGAGSVFVIYLLAKKIFSDEAVGLISAAVFSLDGLPLVLSRIGMNDSYLLFFVLLSIYFFLKEKNILSAMFFGLAISSKWSAVWALPILFLLWLKRKNKQSLAGFAGKKIKNFIWLLVLPPIIYISSYFQIFVSKQVQEDYVANSNYESRLTWQESNFDSEQNPKIGIVPLDMFIDTQMQMWWYHTGLVATHPYTSSWWSWPLLLRPIYLYTSDEFLGNVSRIYAMGNPLVFWFGLISVAVCAIYAYVEKNKNLAFIIFCYLIFFVPWAVSPRIMFLYHYLPSIPFLAIAIGYILRRNPKLAYWVLGIGLLVFIYFYPHWAGLEVPLWLDKSYYWLLSWR